VWSTAVTGGVAAMVNGDREVERRGDRGGERCARPSVFPCVRERLNTVPGLLCVARYADWTRAIARCHALGVELVLYSREQVERVRALVAQRDPILLEAVLDVDRTLIRAMARAGLLGARSVDR
jgi:hypothetical protein